MPSEVALGVIGAVVFVQGFAVVTLNHRQSISEHSGWLVRIVGGYVCLTGLGVLLVLWGLVGGYLKSVDYGILVVSEPFLIQLGSYLLLIGIALSLVTTFYYFTLSPPQQTR